MNNILLCGFMGCGKTTIGQMLAQQLSMDYLDLDQQIEQQTGEKISHMFQVHGEDYFRNLEHQAILELAMRESCVVATGGGAMSFARNRKAVSPQDLCILLDLPFSACYTRICNSDRPLVRAHSRAWLCQLYEKRMADYRQAATFVIDSMPEPLQVADAVAKAYLGWKKDNHSNLF